MKCVLSNFATQAFRASLLGAALLLPVLGAAPAQAQATRTWVSGVGDDANPCSRTAPCKTFAGAISKTAAGGIINCIDPGGFGQVTINKSLTIDCDEVGGGILGALQNGVNVNTAGITVKIRNLTIDGAGTGLIGVNITNGAVVHIENCVITGFTSGTAMGVRAVPPTGVQMELYIADTIISENGNATTNGGLVMQPAGTGAVRAYLDRVQLLNNSVGLLQVAPVGTGFVRTAMIHSEVGGNGGNGVTIQSPGGGGPSVVTIHDSSVSGNGAAGIVADGANAFLLLSTSMVTTNANGLQSLNGGSLLSTKTSIVAGNIGIDGTTSLVAPQ